MGAGPARAVPYRVSAHRVGQVLRSFLGARPARRFSDPRAATYDETRLASDSFSRYAQSLPSGFRLWYLAVGDILKDGAYSATEYWWAYLRNCRQETWEEVRRLGRAPGFTIMEIKGAVRGATLHLEERMIAERLSFTPEGLP